MNELPADVVERVQAMFAVAEADQAYVPLRTAQAALLARGVTADQVERALTACLIVAGRAATVGPRGGWSAAVALRELSAAAARVADDTRGVLLAAGIELTDWHTHLQWEPADVVRNLDFPAPLRELIGACETECVTACCGLAAYDVRADSMVKWAVQHGGPFGLIAALTQLEAELTVVATTRGPLRGHDMLLDHQWDAAADCLAYFDRWRTEAARALAETGGAELLAPEWRTATVRAVVAGVRADRDFGRLPLLADALEDAGCDSEPLLTHLRAGGRHGWFCWAADLLADG